MSDTNEKAKESYEDLIPYIDRMVYDVPPPPKKPEIIPRIEQLALPKKVVIKDVYEEHKDVLQPKERAERIKRKVEQINPMTTEEFEEIMKKKRQQAQKDEEALRDRRKLFDEVLNKLQDKCRHKFMNDILEKFSIYAADISVSERKPEIYSKNFKKLFDCLLFNMYTALNITRSTQCVDHQLFDNLANLFAHMVNEAMFRSFCFAGDSECASIKSDESRDLCGEKKKRRPIGNIKQDKSERIHELLKLFQSQNK